MVWRLTANGAVAQLGEHLLCKQGVVGSNPSSSTILADFSAFCFDLDLEPYPGFFLGLFFDNVKM